MHGRKCRVNLNIVKNLAKLILFFSVNFLILFVFVTCFKFLSLRVEWAKILPAQPETALTLIITAAHWALSLSVFAVILVSVNYIVRKGFSALMGLPCVIILSLVFCLGFSLALENWKSIPPSQSEGVQLGGKGIILSNSLNRNVTAVVLLEGTSNPHGPRVVSIPGQPLAFHETTNVNLNLPPIPFGDDTPWLLRSLSIDIRRNAEVFQQKLTEGLFAFLFYAGSLIFMLSSLGYAIKFSVWSLANLFLAALAFRGIFALTTFFNTPETQEIVSSFLDNVIPFSFALPLFFLGFGILVNLYSLLVFVAKRRDNNGF